MTGRGKMAFRHDRYYQFTISQCVCDALWFRSGTAGNRKPPFLSGGRYQRMVRTTAFTPVAVVIRPLGHLHRVNHIVRQRGHHDCHSGGAAAITANIVRTICFTGIAFIQLIVVNNRCDPVGESNIAQSSDAVSGPRFQILQQTIAQEQA